MAHSIRKRYVNTGTDAYPNAAGGDGTTSVSDYTGTDPHRAYATSAEAEAAEQGDISSATGSDEEVRFYFSGSKNDPTSLSIIGWTCDEKCNVQLYGNWTGPVWDDSKYHKYVTDVHGIEIYEDYTWIFGMQIKVNYYAVASCTCIVQPRLGIRIGGCLLLGDGNASANSKGIDQSGTASSRIFNCVVAGHKGTTARGIYSTGGTMFVGNCTVSDCYYGIRQGGGTLRVESSAVFNNTDDFYGTITILNCASDDGDGTNPQQFTSGATDWSNVFADYSNYDFRLEPYFTDPCCINNGLRTSGFGLYETDVMGVSRALAGACDIGAFEYDFPVEEPIETFYLAHGGDGSAPKDGTVGHAYDYDDFNNSANWTSSETSAPDGLIGPGDRVYALSGGGAITGSGSGAVLIPQASGTPLHHIKYEGDGSVIVDGEDSRMCFNPSTKHYGDVSGFNFKNGYSPAAGKGRVLTLSDNSNHWTVRNCDIGPSTAVGESLCVGGCGQDWLFQYNTIHNSPTGHLVYVFSSDSSHGSHQIIFEYNRFDTSNDAGLIFNGVDVYFYGCIARFNWFEDAGWADIEPCTTDGLQIYCNVIRHTIADRWTHIDIGDDATGSAHIINTRIWNNTLVGYTSAIIWMAGEFDAVTPSVQEFKNNILYVVEGACASPPCSDKTFAYFYDDALMFAASDYNDYYSVPSAPQWKRYGVAKDTSLAAWVSATGLDAASIDSNPLFGDYANGDLSLQAGSPAKGTGTQNGPIMGLHPLTRKGSFGKD